MVETTATATEVQNNFGKYLNMAISGNEVIVTKNGIPVGRIIPHASAVSYLTDSLKGILKNLPEAQEEREKNLRAKYGIID